MWITSYSWICIKKMHSVRYFMTIYTQFYFLNSWTIALNECFFPLLKHDLAASRPRTSSQKKNPPEFLARHHTNSNVHFIFLMPITAGSQQVNASNTHSFTEIAMATKYPTSNLPGWKELQLCFWIGECAVNCTVPSILCYTCLTLKEKGQVRDGNLFICCILVDSNESPWMTRMLSVVNSRERYEPLTKAPQVANE